MVTNTVTALERSGSPTMYFCTTYIHRSLTLAALSILKLSRSGLAQYLDLASGEMAYFACVSILKADSLKYNDLAARGAMILTQLWTSENVFRTPTGTVDGLALRVRSRLSMSIMFDCFWYWREEFGGQPSPFRTEETTIIGKATGPHTLQT
jgi:transcriptional regulatory protein LEU3